MSKDIPTRAKTLDPHEVMDLIRAGIVLVVTVGLTVLVPPTVWGAGPPEQASVQKAAVPGGKPHTPN